MLKKFLYYINPATFFSRKKEKNMNLRFMHGMNRISILVFLFALIVLLVRRCA